MAFTYAIGTSRGKVRAAIGDTVDRTAQRQSLADDEVDYALDRADDDVDAAAVYACEMLVAKLAWDIDSGAGGQSTQLSQRFAQLKELLELLKARAAAGGGIAPVSDLLSETRREEIEDDDDFRSPSFTIGMDDMPAGGTTRKPFDP